MQLRIRTSRPIWALALAALIAFVPSCGKKQSGGGGGDVKISPIASTDHFIFAHWNAKNVRNSTIFAEVKDAFVKQAALNTWEELENQIADQLGSKLSYMQSITFVMPEPPGEKRGAPPLILIMAADSPIPKKMVFGEKIVPAEGRPGFFQIEKDLLVHFPDDRTLVIVHADLVEQYLEGYAKNRSGWPLNADLIKAGEEHTAYAIIKPSKIPADMRNERELAPYRALFEAETATLAIDLRGREIRAELTGKFPSPDKANAAKSVVDKLLADASEAIREAAESPKVAENLGSAIVLVKEALRAVKEAKVSVNGSEVTASTSYRIEINVGDLVKTAVEKVRIAAARAKAMNNLKQIGVAMHNYASANGGDRLIVHATTKDRRPVIAQPGKDGQLDYNPKPLLSWRVAILPYIEQGNLYEQFKHDEPWDSEHNKKLIDKMPKIFESITKPNKPGMTHLQQVIGPQCMWPGRFHLGNISDGSTNTVAVIEAAEPVIWTKPEDVYFSEKENNAPPPKDLKKRFGGQFENGFNVLMWDGVVLSIDSRFVSDSTLWNALRPADGFPLGGDWGR